LGEIRGTISLDLENKFRKLAMKKFGYGKAASPKP